MSKNILEAENKELAVVNEKTHMPGVPENYRAPELVAPRMKVVDGSIMPDFNSRESRDKWSEAAARATGTRNHIVSDLLISHATACCAKSDPKNIGYINAALALMHEIAPKDTFEALLAAQMMAVHYHSASIFEKMHMADQLDNRATLLNMSTKLNRTFVAQLEAFDKHRRKGQQKVIVQHVHVSEGGQAIVGSVEGGGRKN